MAYYLIDYENVNVDGFNGLTSLTEQDRVIVFYSEHASTMTFGLHRRLCETKAVLSFQNVSTGSKNALDFQLATYLGYLVRDTENAAVETFFIVSNDTGFKVLSAYWAHRMINVRLVSDLTKKAVQSAAASTEDQALRSAIQTVLSQKDEVEAVVQIISQCNSKTQINTELTRYFKDGKKVSKIYKAVKPFIKNRP